MKRIFILLALMLMPFAAINAQDARNRNVGTIVADALAQLPAEEPAQYNQIMAELAGTGAQGIEMLATMLKPAAEGVKNSTIEYALNGVASYVTKEGAAQRAAVRSGLKSAFPKVKDEPNQAFVMTVLQICATAEDADFYAAQLKHKYFGNFAARALATVKGTEPAVLALMQAQAENGISRALLAQIASYKAHMHDAEPILLAWAEEATAEDAVHINNALALCGGEASAKYLAKAAKAVGYTFESTDAYGAYLGLLNGHLMKHAPKAVEKAAKQLMKFEKANVRLAGLDLLVQMHGKETTPLVVKAVADPCHEYRYGAMRLAEAYADDATYAAVAATLPKATNAAKIDVINWLGANHAASQVGAVCAQISNPDVEVAVEAMEAASRIGGDEALEAILAKVASIEDTNADDAKTIMETARRVLLSFNGKVNGGIVKALEGNEASKALAYNVLKGRTIPEAAAKVVAEAKGGNAQAAAVLANVVGDNDFNAMCDLFEAGKANTAAINKTLINKSTDEKVAALEARIAKAGDKKSLYYPLLGATGSAKVVPTLVAGYKAGDKAAYEGMKLINDAAILAPLFEIATSDASLKDDALARYIQVTQSSDLNALRKYKNYSNVLEANPSVKVKNQALSALSATQTYQGMMLAAEYMDNAETAQAAANTVLQIATKHPEFYSAEVKALLEKVGATVNDGDAVYKRKDIEKFISENTARESHSIKSELTDKEKKEGFVMLFDGVNTDAWTGNIDAYQVVDGCFYVTDDLSSTGNLYTKEEYADFVLRFEFCFVVEGANNGIGIRTTQGENAAYHGMEIQVLHHDAPMYANLREYQVHGSVYGIIPAKRIKWGPLGEWHSEEIRVKGDRITVTVDGEVIVDGNIRTACKGHNVAPKGGNENPYTVDRLNHPGLFNKKGNIAFCGHGEGVKFRNVRIKEL